MSWLHDLLAAIAVHWLYVVESAAAAHHLQGAASLACHAALWFGALGPCMS